MTKRKPRSPIRSVLALLAIAGTLGAFALSRLPWQPPGLPARDASNIASVATWGYQLQKFDPSRVPDHVDLLVIDYSRDGSDGAALTREDVARLQRRPDGRRRIVLSYLSIGEAEEYRYYWMPFWAFVPPRWLGEENPQWKGNHPVRFWSNDWQDIIVKPERTRFDWLAEQVLPWRKPFLDRILEAGFDGVYLDRVDVYDELKDERRTARADMIKFVEEIAAYARARSPGFLIVPQNAEDLLRSKPYVDMIDAIAKEDLLYGAKTERQPNPRSWVTTGIRNLDRVTAAGKPVMVVEYVDDPDQQAELLRIARDKGYLPLFARRPLDVVPEPVPVLPAPEPEPTPEPRSEPAATNPATNPAATPGDAPGDGGAARAPLAPAAR